MLGGQYRHKTGSRLQRIKNSTQTFKSLFKKVISVYLFVYLLLMTEAILTTVEGQPRPKYAFNNIFFIYFTEVWSITITEL